MGQNSFWPDGWLFLLKKALNSTEFIVKSYDMNVTLTHDDNLKDSQMEENGDKGWEEDYSWDQDTETPDTITEPEN